MSQVLPRGSNNVYGRRVPLAVTAILLARLLAKLPPKRLRKALQIVSRGARPASYLEAHEARTCVISVSIRCSGNFCLERSLAVAILCRFHGMWPTWCSGVRTAPFLAHAWVEADGIAIGEPDHVNELRKMIEIAPK